jgi:hypothetical protein
MIAPDPEEKESPSAPPRGAREKALEYVRFEVLEGKRTWEEAAGDLGTAARTLRRWRQLEERPRFPRRTGRPRKLAGVAKRKRVTPPPTSE